MIAAAYSSALTTFVGQNYGAGLYTRVRQGMKICIGMLSISAIFLSICLMTFGRQIASLFSNDSQVILETVQIIYYIVPYYVTYSGAEIISATMRGCGDAFKPMIIVCCGVCLLRILWVIGIPDIFASFHMVVVCYPISWAATSILFVGYYQNFKNRFLKSV